MQLVFPDWSGCNSYLLWTVTIIQLSLSYLGSIRETAPEIITGSGKVQLDHSGSNMESKQNQFITLMLNVLRVNPNVLVWFWFCSGSRSVGEQENKILNTFIVIIDLFYIFNKTNMFLFPGWTEPAAGFRFCLIRKLKLKKISMFSAFERRIIVQTLQIRVQLCSRMRMGWTGSGGSGPVERSPATLTVLPAAPRWTRTPCGLNQNLVSAAGIAPSAPWWNIWTHLQLPATRWPAPRSEPMSLWRTDP